MNSKMQNIKKCYSWGQGIYKPQNMTPKISEPECINPYSQLIPYFCGNVEKCRQHKSWAWALERAKKNVQNNFAVIGLLEGKISFYDIL